MLKWLIWIPAILLGVFWWMRRSQNARKRGNR